MKDGTMVELLTQLDAFWVVPVRHGRFLGLRGPRLSQIPQAVWSNLGRHEAELLRHLPDEPTPFRRREGHATPAPSIRGANHDDDERHGRPGPA